MAPQTAQPTGHAFDRELHDFHVEKLRVNGVVTIALNNGTSHVRRPRLLLKHLAKSGGTFVEAVCKRLVPYLTVRVEGRAVSKSDQQRHFVIGLVREPCSSYVSMWAYGSGGKGQFIDSMRRYMGPRNASQYIGQRLPYNTSADIARFRSWLRLPLVRGVVAARFLTHYSATPPVDCWVLTDRIAPTLRACLRRYELQGGAVDRSAEASAWAEATGRHTHRSGNALSPRSLAFRARSDSLT